MVEFPHNSWPHEITRKSPFELLMGYNPHTDWIDRPSLIPQVALRLQQFKEARAQAQELMVKAQNLWIKHTSARTQFTARLFTGAQQESSASCTSSQVKYRIAI